MHVCPFPPQVKGGKLRALKAPPSSTATTTANSAEEAGDMARRGEQDNLEVPHNGKSVAATVGCMAGVCDSLQLINVLAATIVLYGR